MNQTPDLNTILRLSAEETITIFPAKVELGQGIYTALAQIAADELCVDLKRFKISPADTDHLPTGSSTTGSNSIQSEGNRQAAVEARYHLLDIASTHLGIPRERLAITDGTIKDREGNQSVTYWNLNPAFDYPITDLGSPKSPEQYTTIGQSAINQNLVAGVTGQPRFLHDLELPNMVHGRVVRPPGPKAVLLSLDLDEVKKMPGVIHIHQSGNFIGVTAEREEQAINAAERLASIAEWKKGNPFPQNIYDHLLSQTDTPRLVVDGTPTDDPIPPIEPPPQSTKTLEATYYKPFHMHGSLGPSAALAHYEGQNLRVISHSQGVHSLRGALAQVLDMPETHIRVQHMEGAGCYGYNGADDVALDAALLARSLPNRPVLLKWMREDEHAWEPYGSCMVIKMQASLDTDHQVIDWNHDAFGHTHSGRPRGQNDSSTLFGRTAHRSATPLSNSAPRRWQSRWHPPQCRPTLRNPTKTRGQTLCPKQPPSHISSARIRRNRQCFCHRILYGRARLCRES